MKCHKTQTNKQTNKVSKDVLSRKSTFTNSKNELEKNKNKQTQR